MLSATAPVSASEDAYLARQPASSNTAQIQWRSAFVMTESSTAKLHLLSKAQVVIRTDIRLQDLVDPSPAVLHLQGTGHVSIAIFTTDEGTSGATRHEIAAANADLVAAGCDHPISAWVASNLATRGHRPLWIELTAADDAEVAAVEIVRHTPGVRLIARLDLASASAANLPHTSTVMAPDAGAEKITLQNIVFPDANICNEPALFFHLNENASLSPGGASVLLGHNGSAVIDTYYNLFNLMNWQNHCKLDGLDLVLSGRGRVGLTVWLATPDPLNAATIFEDVIDLDQAGIAVDLSAALAETARGARLVTFRLTALQPAELTGGRFRTRAPQGAMPELVISVTTFRREEDVADTARRVAAFIDGYEHGAHVRLLVVDNGKSAQIDPHPRVTYIPNENLGGAGGFARGLTEATRMGASHCLFMDDDASFLTESFLRSYAFLALAQDSRAAVSGAMISNARKWAMWENGAVFDRFCHPQFVGTDLRDSAAVSWMEFTAAEPKPAQSYGGWWFFAFPIAHVERYPFPFFVRGDDINFSLSNCFSLATINGVVSFQDDFSAKESALNLYLDLRNHMVQHLSLPALEIGATRVLRIPLRFLWRYLSRFHYETAEALLLSWEDVMQGPQFFAENADMASRRREIGACVKQEKWLPADISQLPPPRKTSPYSNRVNKLIALTVNGHLFPLPDGSEISVPIELRGLMHPIWGARKVTFFNTENDQAYTVALDRWRGIGILWRALKLSVRFQLRYRNLVKSYQTAHPKIASREFWEQKFAAAEPDTSGKS